MESPLYEKQDVYTGRNMNSLVQRTKFVHDE